MPAIVEQSLAVPGGGILYDASRLRKPQGSLFSREHWQSQGALKEVAGGRGSVCFLSAPEGAWVWRHYRRGGFVARMVADAYLWLGAARTRSFAEWRLLARLRALGLPVPAPIAAGYVRTALAYRADIITEELPNARTLAAAMSATPLPPEQWRNVGRTSRCFIATACSTRISTRTTFSCAAWPRSISSTSIAAVSAPGARGSRRCWRG